MKVLVLGAGASKAYDGSKCGARMPIARDFLETFARLPISEHPWVLTGNVLCYGRDHKGIHLENFYNSGIDIEELHSEVETKMLAAFDDCRTQRHSTPEAIILHGVYLQLVFMFAATVNEIQNGEISTAHVHLAKTLDSHDVAITFNWDTLMDRALNVSTPWRPDSGYGINPHQIFRDGWKSPRRPGARHAPRLLKLHGSTNWISSYLQIGQKAFALSPMQAASPDRLYVYEFTRKPYATYAGRFMEGYEEFSYGYYPPNLQDDPGKSAPDGMVFFRIRPKLPGIPEGQAADSGLVSMPLIIPPVKNKSYAVFGELFSGIWTQAEAALTKATEIAIIGYSFPQTDHRSLDLFRSALSKRKKPPLVTVVDPTPSRVVELLVQDFRIPASNIQAIAEYFSPAFECARLWSRRGGGAGRRPHVYVVRGTHVSGQSLRRAGS